MRERLTSGITIQSAIAILLLAAALAVGAFAPQSAYAADKVGVFVMKSMTITEPHTDYDDVDATEFTYYANGLVKKAKRTELHGGMKYKYAEKFKYSKLALKTVVSGYSGDKAATSKYKTDSKGRVVGLVGQKCTWKYDKKGRLAKLTYPSGGTAYITYSYDSKGCMKKSYWEDNYYGDAIWTFKYDSHGQVKKATSASIYKPKNKTVYTFKNTYKGSRLVKQVTRNKTDGYVVDIREFKYQKISVPKNAVNMVKAQQQAYRSDHVMGAYQPVDALPNVIAAHR